MSESTSSASNVNIINASSSSQNINTNPNTNINNNSESVTIAVRALRLGTKQVTVCRDTLERLVRLLGATVNGTRSIQQQQHATNISSNPTSTSAAASSSSESHHHQSSNKISAAETRNLRRLFQSNNVGGPGAVLNALQVNGTDVSVAELSLAIMVATLLPATTSVILPQSKSHHSHSHHKNKDPAILAIAAVTNSSPLLPKMKIRNRVALRKLVKKWVKKNGTRLLFAALVKHFEPSLPLTYIRGIVIPVCRLAHAFLLGDAKVTTTARLSGALQVLCRIVLSYSNSSSSSTSTTSTSANVTNSNNVSLETLSIILTTLVSLSNVRLSLSALNRNGLGVIPVLTLIRNVLGNNNTTSSSNSSSSHNNSLNSVINMAHSHNVARWLFRILFYFCVVDSSNIKVALENNVVDVCIAVLERCTNIVSTGLHCGILDVLTLLLFGTPFPGPIEVGGAQGCFLVSSSSGSGSGGGGKISNAAYQRQLQRRAIISIETEKLVTRLVARAAVSPAIRNPRDIIDLYNHLTKFLGMTELPLSFDCELGWKPINGCPNSLLKTGGGAESSDDDDPNNEDGDDDSNDGEKDNSISEIEKQMITDTEDRMQRRVSLLFPEVNDGPSFRVARETLVDFDSAVEKVNIPSQFMDNNNNNNQTDKNSSSSSFYYEKQNNKNATNNNTNNNTKTQPPSWSARSTETVLPVEPVPLDPLPDSVFCTLARNQFLRLVDPQAPVAQVVYDNIPVRSKTMPKAYAVPPNAANSGVNQYNNSNNSNNSAPSPTTTTSSSSTTANNNSSLLIATPTPPSKPNPYKLSSSQQQNSSNSSNNINNNNNKENTTTNVFAIPQLVFDSNFECGNLKRVIRVGEADYDIITSGDTNTFRQGQWFYFSIRNMVVGVQYTFRFVNFDRAGSTFGAGNRPLMFSDRLYAESGTGWMRCGEEIAYFKNSFVKPTPELINLSLSNINNSNSNNPANSNNPNTSSVTSPVSPLSPSFASSTTSATASTKKNSKFSSSANTTNKTSSKQQQQEQDKNEDESDDNTTNNNPKEEKPSTSSSSASSKKKDQQQREATVQSLIAANKQTLNTLHFTLRFPFSGDKVFICPFLPYSYSDLLKYLKYLPSSSDCIEQISPSVMIQSFCETDAGLQVPIITITSLEHEDTKTPVSKEEIAARPVCVVSARVHPGETPSSFCAKGLIDFLVDPVNPVSRALRNSTCWKIIPMLNPDGVVNGHYRCDLHGFDLNRMFLNPLAIKTPTIAYLNQLFKQIRAQGRRCVFYGDFHGHSKKTGSFTFACGSQRRAVHGAVVESIFPAVLHSLLPGFDPESCTYRVMPSKLATGRVQTYRSHDIRLSYTLEVSMMGGFRFAPISTGEDEEMLERDAVRGIVGNVLEYHRHQTKNSNKKNNSNSNNYVNNNNIDDNELVLNTPQSLCAIGAMFAKAFYCVSENFLSVRAEDLFRVKTVVNNNNNDSSSSSSSSSGGTYKMETLPRRGMLAETAAALLIAHASAEKSKRVKSLHQQIDNNPKNTTATASRTQQQHGGENSSSTLQNSNNTSQQQQQQNLLKQGDILVTRQKLVTSNQISEALSAMFPKVSNSQNQNNIASSLSNFIASPVIASTTSVSYQLQLLRNNSASKNMTDESFTDENNANTNNIETPSTPSSTTKTKKSTTTGGKKKSSQNKSSESSGSNAPTCATSSSSASRRKTQIENDVQVVVAWGGKPKEFTITTVPPPLGASSSISVISTNVHTPVWQTSISQPSTSSTSSASPTTASSSSSSSSSALHYNVIQHHPSNLFSNALKIQDDDEDDFNMNENNNNNVISSGSQKMKNSKNSSSSNNTRRNRIVAVGVDEENEEEDGLLNPDEVSDDDDDDEDEGEDENLEEEELDDDENNNNTNNDDNASSTSSSSSSSNASRSSSKDSGSRASTNSDTTSNFLNSPVTMLGMRDNNANANVAVAGSSKNSNQIPLPPPIIGSESIINNSNSQQQQQPTRRQSFTVITSGKPRRRNSDTCNTKTTTTPTKTTNSNSSSASSSTTETPIPPTTKTKTKTTTSSSNSTPSSNLRKSSSSGNLKQKTGTSTTKPKNTTTATTNNNNTSHVYVGNLAQNRASLQRK